MSDPADLPGPVLEAEPNPATDPIDYVAWVHFGDPGWYEAEPGGGYGTTAVAWQLYFDGQRVARHRGEPDPSRSPTDPWWMRTPAYRDMTSGWQAHGGGASGTVVTFWVGGDDIEYVEEEVLRLRVKVCGRDILIPLGAPVPTPPRDPGMPVQVTMYVNRFTVGPVLDSPDLWPRVPDNAPITGDTAVSGRVRGGLPA